MKKQQKIDVTNKKNHGLPVILFFYKYSHQLVETKKYQELEN